MGRSRRWKRWRNRAVGALGAVGVRLLRATCRVRVEHDERPRLRAARVPYVYALLHAHQISAVLVNDEAHDRLAAMVSRSADGDVLVPSLRAVGVLAARGSSRRRGRDKGGREALDELREMLDARIAVLLAVDGPQGPRNTIHRGVSRLPFEVPGAVVLPTVVVPTRRWILRRTWDRMQVAKPWSTITLAFAPAITPEPGESSEAIRERISTSLDQLEARYDPEESRHSADAARARQAKAG